MTGKAADVWKWIESIGDREFTTSEVAQVAKVPLREVKRRYLKHLISVGLIETIKFGGKGQGDAAIYKCPKTAQNVDVDKKL